MASLTLLMSTNNLKTLFWNTVGQTNTLKPTEKNEFILAENYGFH